MSYNVNLEGNIGWIGEKRVVGKDKRSVLDFSVIVNHPKTDANGKFVDNPPTTLQYCTVWNRLADNFEESLSVGDAVVVSGRLKTGEDYTNKDGEEVTPRPIVTVDDIGASLRYATLEITKNSGGSKSKPAAKKSTTKKTASKKAPEPETDGFDDDELFSDDDF